MVVEIYSIFSSILTRALMDFYIVYIDAEIQKMEIRKQEIILSERKNPQARSLRLRRKKRDQVKEYGLAP